MSKKNKPKKLSITLYSATLYSAAFRAEDDTISYKTFPIN